MTLLTAPKYAELTIKDILLEDDELVAFLFSLGCYTGEPITILQQRRNGCIVVIKDGRYNFDKQLANAIIV